MLAGRVESLRDFTGRQKEQKARERNEFGTRPLRELHFTMMNKVFDMSDVNDFGQDLTGKPIKVVSEIIA